MMFSVYFGICVLAISCIYSPTYAAPATLENKPKSDILYYENNNDGSGNYKFSFQTIDNTKREEIGVVENGGLPDQYIRVYGSYSYIRPDGKEETVSYIADKDGYRIVEDEGRPHSVVFASIPSAVLASLAG